MGGLFKLLVELTLFQLEDQQVMYSVGLDFSHALSLDSQMVPPVDLNLPKTIPPKTIPPKT